VLSACCLCLHARHPAIQAQDALVVRQLVVIVMEVIVMAVIVMEVIVMAVIVMAVIVMAVIVMARQCMMSRLFVASISRPRCLVKRCAI